MPWPTAPVITLGLDADTDTLPRADILDLTTKFNQLIAMRGVANGVCELDAGLMVPLSRIPSSIQRSDALLGALAGQTTAANQIQGYSGVDAVVLLSTGTATGNVPLVGTASSTETIPGLIRRPTQAEAEAGVENTAAMTALRVKQAISAQSPYVTYTSPASPAMSGGVAYVVNHGLGVQPTSVMATMRCNTIDLGYAVGDEVQLSTDIASNTFTIYASATQLAFVMGVAAIAINHKSTYVGATITLSRWNIYLRAIK